MTQPTVSKHWRRVVSYPVISLLIRLISPCTYNNTTCMHIQDNDTQRNENVKHTQKLQQKKYRSWNRQSWASTGPWSRRCQPRQCCPEARCQEERLSVISQWCLLIAEVPVVLQQSTNFHVWVFGSAHTTTGLLNCLIFSRPYTVVRSLLWYDVLSVCLSSVCNVLYCG